MCVCVCVEVFSYERIRQILIIRCYCRLSNLKYKNQITF